MFAKLFETERGQVLAKLGSHPETLCPEVRFFCEPEGLGVCEVSMTFSDNGEGWDLAEKLLDSIKSAEDTAKYVDQVFAGAAKMAVR